jgi:hypothetical protein
MVSPRGKHPGQLQDQVTSPVATTIAGFRSSGRVISAVVAAAKQCCKLSYSLIDVHFDGFRQYCIPRRVISVVAAAK